MKIRYLANEDRHWVLVQPFYKAKPISAKTSKSVLAGIRVVLFKRELRVYFE